MTPVEIRDALTRGMNFDAVMARHAADIQREQGIDMGLSMSQARTDVQNIQNARDEGIDPPQIASPVAPIIGAQDIALKPLEKALTFTPPAAAVAPIRTGTPIGSMGLQGNLPPVDLQQQALMDMPAPSIGTPNLRDIDIQARAALPSLAGMQQAKLASDALMDMPAPEQQYRLGAAGLESQNILAQLRAEPALLKAFEEFAGRPVDEIKAFQSPSTVTEAELMNLKQISDQAYASLPSLAGLQQDNLATQALMDMPTGMSPAQRYAMKFGDTGAYNIYGGDLTNIDTAARSALNDLSLSNFREIVGGLNDTSISDTPTYQRLRDLGYTDTQANAIARQNLNLDIDAATEMIKSPKELKAMEDMVAATKAASQAKDLYSTADYRKYGAPSLTFYAQKGVDPIGETKKIKQEERDKWQQVIDTPVETYLERMIGEGWFTVGKSYKLKSGKTVPASKLTEEDRMELALREKEKVDKGAKGQQSDIDDFMSQSFMKGNPKQNMDKAYAEIEKAKRIRDSAEVMGRLSDIDAATEMLAGANGLDAALSGVKAEQPNTVSKYTSSAIYKESTSPATSASTNFEDFSDFEGLVSGGFTARGKNTFYKPENETQLKAAKDAGIIPKDKTLKQAQDDADTLLKSTVVPQPTITPTPPVVPQPTITPKPPVGTQPPAGTPPMGTNVIGGGGFAPTPSAQLTGLGELGGVLGDRSEFVSSMLTPEQQLSRYASFLPTTALTPRMEEYMQEIALPQMEAAFYAQGGKFNPEFNIAGSPYSAFENFMRTGSRLDPAAFQEYLGEVSGALQAADPTQRQQYLSSLYATPEQQLQLLYQQMAAGGSQATRGALGRMLGRQYRQQQFQSPESAFLPSALARGGIGGAFSQYVTPQGTVTAAGQPPAMSTIMANQGITPSSNIGISGGIDPSRLADMAADAAMTINTGAIPPVPAATPPVVPAATPPVVPAATPTIAPTPVVPLSVQSTMPKVNRPQGMSVAFGGEGGGLYDPTTYNMNPNEFASYLDTQREGLTPRYDITGTNIIGYDALGKGQAIRTWVDDEGNQQNMIVNDPNLKSGMDYDLQMEQRKKKKKKKDVKTTVAMPALVSQGELLN